MILNSTKSTIKHTCFIVIAMISLSCNHGSSTGTSNPRINGVVPNKETAIKIAEAVWLPIYGDDVLDEKPFIARLDGNIWTVEGTLHATHGGAAIIRLQKTDGRIIVVSHGK